MLKQLQNIKSITIDINNILTPLQAIKKSQKKITLNIDYNSKTIYINGKDILYTIKGF